jgi:hypothetical protein
MTRETTTRQVKELYTEQEMYTDSDAATKRRLEVLANSISHFREAVHHIAGNQAQPASIAKQLEGAQRRRQSAQRRVMLEWVAAMALCVALLLPGIGYYRNHVSQVREQKQAQALRQRESDAALLDQVAIEVSEEVPDSMQPLAEMDSDYVSDQVLSGKTEKNNGTN